ncbi:tetratricopeptide repeat protein [Hymenobacter negativus]|uniref:Tetratricopeptide repeat protein n=1 Tax=Hymenobacter negativus TaxID=2795026 RepID=A0ABS0Q4M4_9BACT|nr:tetratricopeptide repeat protein [Hymenobacter negativus]MBH8557515.1 tetratricopeptide repeat protein [Hymenobacter negativus]
MAHSLSAGSAGLARVWLLLEHRRPQQAAQLARQCLAADPVHAPTHLALAEALRQLGRLDEARQSAQTAIGLAPEDAQCHHLLALILGQQGHLRKAELVILDAIRLNPVSAVFFGFLAQVRYLLHRPAEALASANNGLALDARNVECLLWRALAQEQRDHPEAADEDFHRLLHVAPTNHLVHARRGLLLLNRFEPAAAEPHLAEALRQAPNRAAQLLPLLQRARREQHWPIWFLRSERQVAERRALGLEPGLSVLFYRICGTGAVVRAWWRTRHDPIFRLSPKQVWQRRLGFWVAGILLLPPLILLGDYLGLINASIPLTQPQSVGLAVGVTASIFIPLLIMRKLNE